MAAGQVNAPAVFDLKSASLSVVALPIQTSNLDILGSEFARRFDNTPGLFNNDPVVLDLALLSATHPAIDFAGLIALLKRFKMQLVGVRAGTEQQMQHALLAGLFEVPPDVSRPSDIPSVSHSGGASSGPSGSSGGATPATQSVGSMSAPIPLSAPTLVIDRPLRSGQQIYARGGDLVLLAAVNFGAEVIADGHIHAYAPLRGKAIAGAKGNHDARIFTTCMEPELVAIAGTYRTTETPLPAEVIGKPAQIRLDGERLVFEALL